MEFVGLLFMLAVIVIGIAMLPQALNVLAGALPMLLVLAAVVGAVALLAAIVTWVWSEVTGVRLCGPVRDWLANQFGTFWGLALFVLIWGVAWTVGVVGGGFGAPLDVWSMSRLLAVLLGIATIGLPLWMFAAHRLRRVRRAGKQ